MVSIDVRTWAAMATVEEPFRRDLRAGVQYAELGRELSHHTEAPGPCGTLDLFGEHCPAECELGGDEFCPFAVEKIDEVTKRLGGLSVLTPQGASEFHILVERVTDFHHWATSIGQLRATWRRASNDT